MDACIKTRTALPSDEWTDLIRPSREDAEAAVRTLIAYAGDDPAREGLLDTPGRVVDAYGELFQGYNECPVDVLDKTFSETAGYDDFVLVKDISFNSHCEHHMMPFFGKAHVAYRPVDRVVGISKLARLVDVYAQRLQTQEHLTSQVATAIDEILKPRGVAVLIEAEHMCMSLRGVTKPGALTVTSHFTGMFRDDVQEQVRFMAMVRGQYIARFVSSLTGRIAGGHPQRCVMAASKEIEEGTAFAPNYDADGLITAVVTDAASGELLMVAHMNADALGKTIESGEAWYFSRSRQKLWKKGEESGNSQRVKELRVDCDQDAVWLKVEQVGEGACHTGRRSCFYRAVPLGKAGAVTLEFKDAGKTFNPDKVYKK